MSHKTAPKSLEGWQQYRLQDGSEGFVNTTQSEVWAPPPKHLEEWQLTANGKFRPLCGSLRFGIVDASGLQAPGRSEDPDSYIAVYTDQNGKLIKKAHSDPRFKTKNPSWFEYFDVSVDYGRFAWVSVRQPPRFKLGKGEEFATGLIDLALIADSVEHDIHLKLHPTGELYLKLHFTDETGMFGMDLRALVKRERRTFLNIPTIIEMCVHHVDKHGMDNVGMYRLCGSVSAIETLRKRFNYASPKTIVKFGDEGNDVNNIGSLLKAFLRELPEPLVPFARYYDFIAAAQIDDTHFRAQKSAKFRQLIHSLPAVQRANLLFLLNHLYKLAQMSEQNKMTPRNIGTCFGPSLLHPPPATQAITTKSRKSRIAPAAAGENMTASPVVLSEAAQLALQARIVEFMVENWPELMNPSDAESLSLASQPTTVASPPVPKHSETAAKGAASALAPVPTPVPAPHPGASIAARRASKSSFSLARQPTLDSSTLAPTEETSTVPLSGGDSIALHLFLKHDKDGSKVLEPDEFIALCSELGLSKEKATLLLKEFDRDGDGNISYDEFVKLIDKIDLAASLEDTFSKKTRKTKNCTLAAASSLETALDPEHPEGSLSPLTPAVSKHLDFEDAIAMEAEASSIPSTIRNLFLKYDEDCSGSINATELGKLLFDAGCLLSEHELAFTMQRLADADGEISFATFADFWLKDDKFKSLHLNDEQMEHIHRASSYFQHFDTDGNGSLDKEEFAKLYEDLHNYGLNLPPMEECFKELDSDGSGGIAYNEYIQWLIKTKSIDVGTAV